MKVRFWLQLCLVAAFLSATGCGGDKDNASDQHSTSSPGKQDTSTESSGQEMNGAVLARVDGLPITESDLDRLVYRIGGEGTEALVSQALSSDENRKKMLESLVSSRAMAILEEKQLSAEQKNDLDKKVAAYREELLVKSYLQEHADIQPVSNDMVKTYYAENALEFAEEPQYRFEVLTSYGEVTEDQRKEILNALATAKNTKDWKALEQKLIKNKLPIKHQTAKARPGLLSADIRALLEKTAPVSEISAINKTPRVSDVDVKQTIKVVRVLEITPGAVKPIAEVSANIRKRLAPIMMKQAVAEASLEARKNVDISYQ
jgi:hypothetical protein